MCAFTVNLIDFDKLTPKQKRDLLNNYKKKKATLEALIKDANKSLQGIDKAIGIMQKKTKRRA
jgi:transcriptional regulator of heat shock response